MSSPALITPLIVNVLPHILATNVPSNFGRNPPSWLVIFLVVPCNKITLFSKDLITLIRFFISLFVRVISFPKTLSELLL